MKGDYDVFKKSVLAQYLGGEKGIKCARRNTKLIIASPSNDNIPTEPELLQYYRKFRPFAMWLVVHERISTHERNHYC